MFLLSMQNMLLFQINLLNLSILEPTVISVFVTPMSPPGYPHSLDHLDRLCGNPGRLIEQDLPNLMGRKMAYNQVICLHS